jgi:hypothetical protein
MCCNTLNISAKTNTNIDKLIVGKYNYDHYHNGYPVYKKVADSDLYLFYDKDRWILERQVQESKTAEGKKSSGIIKYKGDYICPDSVGKRWTYRTGNFNNITTADQSINVTCSTS